MFNDPTSHFVLVKYIYIRLLVLWFNVVCPTEIRVSFSRISLWFVSYFKIHTPLKLHDLIKDVVHLLLLRCSHA